MSRTDHPCYGDHNFLKSTRKCQWCGKYDPSHQIAMAAISDRIVTIKAREREESETLMNKGEKKKEMDVSKWETKRLISALRLVSEELLKRRVLAPTVRVETFMHDSFRSLERVAHCPGCGDDIRNGVCKNMACSFSRIFKIHNFDFYKRCVICGLYEDYVAGRNIECVR